MYIQNMYINRADDKFTTAIKIQKLLYLCTYQSCSPFRSLSVQAYFLLAFESLSQHTKISNGICIWSPWIWKGVSANFQVACIHLFISQGQYIKENSDIKHMSRFQREGSWNLFKANIIVFAMAALNEWKNIPISNDYSTRITCSRTCW